MVAAATQHDTKWVSPSPLWNEFIDTSTHVGRTAFHRPAILRFNSDNFMDELMSVMSYHPERLVEWKARPETWREPMPTPPTASKLALNQPISDFSKSRNRLLKTTSGTVASAATIDGLASTDTESKPLKLYQPAHQRFYLVTASFVCRLAGLPDRKIELPKQQKVEFVLRRLLPMDLATPIDPENCDPSQCDEYAYVLKDKDYHWVKVGSGESAANKVLVVNEERLAMFNVGYEETADRKRRMLAGYIPVGKRESYLNSEIDEDVGTEATGYTAAAQQQRDAIAQLFSMQVGGPWKRLISSAQGEDTQVSDWLSNAPSIVERPIVFPSDDNARSNLKQAREKIQTASWYVLVDLAQFLKDYLPNLYTYIATSSATGELTVGESALYDAFADITLDSADYNDAEYIGDSYHSLSDLYQSLIDALKHVIDHPEEEVGLDLLDYPYDRNVENTTAEYAWPSFLFPLADPVKPAPLPDLPIAEPSDAEPDISHDQVDALAALVAAAIPSVPPKPAPEVRIAKAPRQSNQDGWFIIRCVFDSPNCGPFHPAIVSESTDPFKMASFFDPDAPSRPINIPMPMDVSPAGLRKFNQNATFMISDALCGKLRGVRKTTLGDLVLSVLPWPFHKDLPDPGETGPCAKGGTTFGMFCSLSIPIVTLCAFILLTIMVTLFDIFFRWIPYFFICLPIPGLKGKN